MQSKVLTKCPIHVLSLDVVGSFLSFVCLDFSSVSKVSIICASRAFMLWFHYGNFYFSMSFLMEGTIVIHAYTFNIQ